MLLMMSLVLLRGRARLIMACIQSLNVVALLVAEWLWPQSILRLADFQATHINRTSGFLMSLVLMSALVLSVLSSYSRLLGKFRILSVKDGLTDLYNHKFITERLAEELSVSIRHQQELSVILLDIDHFKAVNDELGHQAGDEVLRRVPVTLRHQVRRHDVIGRYGGEEFLIILPHTDMSGARVVAEKLRLAILNERYLADGRLITVSLGVASLGSGKESMDLVKLADQRLYQAKNGGRNRVVSE
jgi:diguanylate cyclase (GGDEF)-like protein